MPATNAVPVDASNTEQLRAWDGDEGAYWAAHAAHFDRSAIPDHRRLLASASTPVTALDDHALGHTDPMRTDQ